MANLESILQQLKQERDRLNTAIQALQPLVGSPARQTAGPRTTATPRRGRRKLGAAARARIAAAQRARWAKFHAKKH